MTKAKIKKEIEDSIKQSDPNLDAGSMQFKAAAVLLASSMVGPDSVKIARILMYPVETVLAFGEALTRNGIWRDGKVHADWSGENGGLAFWVDVCVALGWLSRGGRAHKSAKVAA